MLDVHARTSPGGGQWRRSVSAGDLLAMSRTPTRRPFDSAQPPEDLLASPCNSKSRLRFQTDPLGRMKTPTFLERSGKLNLLESKPLTRERACDYTPYGETMRLANHIEPKKFRPLSLHGEVFQGRYIHDWRRVESIQQLRDQYPFQKKTTDLVPGPYPQGPTQKDLNRNRNFDWSHGSEKKSGGYVVLGAQVLLP